jgi:hypothetical protein
MSCLFESLATYMEDITPDELRKLICIYLSKNPKLMDGLDLKTILKTEECISTRQYVSRMKNSSTWGGAIEIKAFCDMFNLNVNVVCDGRLIKFTPISNKRRRKTITIHYVGGNHYTAHQ